MTNESIFLTIKGMLGFEPEYAAFDADILFHINSAISILRQLGVGEPNFRVTGTDETWQDYIKDLSSVDLVKEYIFLKTKNVFDTPTNSFLVTANENYIKELEFRILVSFDPYIEEPKEEETEE